jgi:hypothetical protein
MACGNLMVSVDQQQDLQRQTQNETVNVRKTVTLLFACVTSVHMKSNRFQLF